jgi:signal transduction histidine kinase
MKLAFAFLFDNAAWPVFLVDDSGIIRASNSSAVNLLGTVMERESALSAAAWSPDNELTSEEFLRRVDRTTSQMTVMKFRAKGGLTTEFNTCVCSLIQDHQKYFLFQLFPAHPRDKAGSGTGVSPAPEGAGPEASKMESHTELRSETFSFESSEAHRQKLECALKLARTVSLDFNNALTGILGHASLILSKIEPSHPWRNSLVEVEKSAQRAAEIAQDLAAFSRQEPRAQVPGNLNDVLRRTVEVFNKPTATGVLWTLQLERLLYTVKFDEAKMQQAFIKILENAVEAVGADGRILVRTFNQTVEEGARSPAINLPPGLYVCVEVTDNGCGIATEALPRVFEPFFTTKKTPEHRGLGLAWVYGIVTNHGGTVLVTSPPGQGTSVRLFLPARQKIVRDRGGTRFESLRGDQTILMVDDEETLLTLGQTVLSGFGYKVLTANSGERALELFLQAPTQIDLVITDMVMPSMGGRELIDRIRRISPTIPIIGTSGYLRPTGEEDEDEMYLRKPFTSHDLLRKVKQALTRPEGS